MTDADAKQEENRKLEAIHQMAREVGDLTGTRQFSAAEERLRQLKQLIADSDFTDSRKRDFAAFMYSDYSGRNWAVQAVEAFTANVDPLGSNTYSLRAIQDFEDSVRLAQSIDLGDTKEQDEAEQQMLSFQQAQLEDARGMKDLNDGEHRFRRGQYELARTSLVNAQQNLSRAEEAFAADDEKQNIRPSPGFADIALAKLEELNSEEALIGGDLKTAAEAEKARAAALESATRKHAISDISTSDYFARRYKQDADCAHDRARLFRSASALQGKRPWFASYIFFFLAIGSVALLVYLMGSLNLIENPFVLGLILIFVFVISGVATKLGEWSKGAEILTSLVKSAQNEGSGSDSS